MDNALLTEVFHIHDQLSKNRTTDLKCYTDEGFAALRRSLDQFRAEFHDYIGALHVEIDRRFLETTDNVATAATSQQRAVDAALSAAEKAVDKANDASEKRFDAVNEFRGQQKDIISGFLSRSEYSVQHKTLVDATDLLRSELSRLSGDYVRREENETWRSQMSERLTQLNLRLTEIQGTADGVAQAAVAAASRTQVRILIMGLVISTVVVIVNVVVYYLAHK